MVGKYKDFSILEVTEYFEVEIRYFFSILSDLGVE